MGLPAITASAHRTGRIQFGGGPSRWSPPRPCFLVLLGSDHLRASALFPIDLIRHATDRIGPSGEFHPRDLPALRAAVEAIRSSPTPLDHPAALFGPWEGLAGRARSALRRMVEQDMAGALDWLPSGYLWTSLIRGGWELDRFLHVRSMAPRVRGRVVSLTCRLAGGPTAARARIVDRIRRRRWGAGSRAGPQDMLAALDRSPRWLLGDFAQGIQVDARARGYFHDPSRNVVTAYYVGLDLMPTPSGICCIEANLRPGIDDSRWAVLDGDPMVDGILNAAVRQKARHVLWLEGEGPPLPARIVSDLRSLARAAGIRGEVLEDPRMPSRSPLPSGIERPNRWGVPLAVPENTLVVRRNEFPVGSDSLVAHKEPFIRSLHSELLKTGGNHGVFTLPMTRVPLQVPDPAGPGLPNLVYKYPDSFAGKGVFFLRARDTEHATTMARELDQRHGEPPGMFQPFICPYLLENRRVYDVRVELLVSPLGVWYLGSMRRESTRSIPEEIPHGVSPSEGVFASNLNRGGVLTMVPRREEEKVRAAARTVGLALQRILGRTFVAGPGEAPGRHVQS